MTTNNLLCSYCLEIPLEKIRQEPGDYYGDRFSLGPLSRVHNSRCPLCRLVVRAVTWTRRTDVTLWSKTKSSDLLETSSPKLELKWVRSSVPGLRSAFDIYGVDGCRGAYIAFGAANRTPSGDSNNEGPSCLLPNQLPELDLVRVSKWVSNCTTNHDCVLLPRSSPFSRVFPGLKVLRLIDVTRNCLIETSQTLQYVVLSYVWGSVPNFRLTKANRHKLMLPGALQKVEHLLPLTIRNAITLVRKLQIRYLWVDSICLLQNDKEDLEQGVGVMDQIYEHSFLTVIAAHGHDADAGLAGTEIILREPQDLLNTVKPGISMGLMKDPDIRLKRLVYETRAWTFQEHFLSRRKLYFFEDEVTFRCRQCECLETCCDTDAPKLRNENSSSLLWDSTTWNDPLIEYIVVLENYTARNLTNQSDILFALAGISRRFSERLRCRMLEGIPTGTFDYFIPFAGINIRRRAGFPSYSWAGWIGKVDLDSTGGLDVNPWLQDHTWIIWYKRSQSGVLNLVWDPEANPSFIASDPKLEGYRRRSRFQCPLSGSINTARTTPAQEPPHLERPVPSYPILQFYTMVVYMKLGALDVFKPQASLFGRDGQPCGHMFLDGFEGTTFFESDNPFELVLLSEAQTWYDIYKMDQVTWSWDYYFVMVIEWDGGLAERRGIGVLKKKAIQQSFQPGPQWKEIILG